MKRKSKRRAERTAFAALIVVAVITTVASLHQTVRYQRLITNQTYEHSAEDAQRARDQVKRKCARLPVPERAGCVEPIIAAAREEQRREYEVHAEQLAALWNETMGRAALMGIVFSVASLVLIYMAFTGQRADARRSKKAARKSAEAASEALAHARETTQAELRPYLLVDRVTAEPFEGDAYLVRVWLRNFGKTPARTIEGQVHSYPGTKLHRLSGYVRVTDVTNVGVCAPGHERQMEDYVRLAPEVIRAIRDNEQYLIVRIRYHYRSNFGNWYEKFDYFTCGRDFDENVFSVLSQRIRDKSRERAAKQSEMFPEHRSASRRRT